MAKKLIPIEPDTRQQGIMLSEQSRRQPIGQVEVPKVVSRFNIFQSAMPQNQSRQIPRISESAPAQEVAAGPSLQQPQRTLRRAIPEQALISAQELRPWNMREAIPGASLPRQAAVGAMQPLTINDEEVASMLKQADPEIIVERDRSSGAFYVYSPATQKSFVINKPGISLNDASNLAATIVAAIPAGRAATMAGRAGLEAAIQAGIESGQRSLGGEFNVEEPLISGAFSAGADLVSLWNQSRRAAQVQSSAQAQGASPELSQVGADLSRISTSAPASGIAGASAQGSSMSGQAQSLRDIVRPSERVVTAAEELGLSEVLPLRVFSQNPQYVQVEQALSRMPGSAMAEGEREALLAVSQKADEFIQAFGGTRDIASLDANIVNNFNSTLDDLRSRSDIIYDNLNQVVVPRTRVDANEVRSYLVNKARDLGGVSKLNSFERNLLVELRDKRRITYARLDQLRQEVGERYGNALKGNSFGDTTTFSLKGLYNVLTDAQGSALEAISSPQVREQWDVAKGLVSQRKALEDTATSLLGREFTRPILPQVSGAINSLFNGNVRGFTQTLNSIPDQYRQAAVVSAMDSLFTKGSKTQIQLNMGGFASQWDKLSRSPEAKKALINELPEGAERFLDNLAVISRQYSSALASVPATGVIKAMGDFGSDNGFIAKILPMIPVAGNRISGIFSYSGPEATSAAANLMASPDFRRIVVRGAQGQNTQQAESALSRSPVFRAWTETLPINVKNRVLTMGLTDYLYEDSEE